MDFCLEKPEGVISIEVTDSQAKEGVVKVTIINALLVKPLRNWEFKDWPKMMTSAPIFLKLIYFRQKYLDAYSLSVSLSIHIWVRVENSQIQQ